MLLIEEDVILVVAAEAMVADVEIIPEVVLEAIAIEDIILIIAAIIHVVLIRIAVAVLLVVVAMRVLSVVEAEVFLRKTSYLNNNYFFFCFLTLFLHNTGDDGI